MADWSSDYVGIPYLKHGYDRNGADCWGLVRLVLLEQFGVVIPRHDEIAPLIPQNRPETGKIGGLTGFEPIARADVAPGDVWHLWGISGGLRVPCHVGVVVSPGKILHTEAGTGAIIEPEARKRMAWRLIGAYRAKTKPG